MATLAALTDDVLNMLYGVAQVERPAEDTQVTATFTDSATEIELSTPAFWRRGDIAEADDGDVIILAEDHPAAGSTVTVRRGQRGSTATEHLTATAVWSKNPSFLRTQIERFINEVVRNDLWPKVWSWHNGTITWVDDDFLYDLPAYIDDVALVYQYELNSDNRFHPFDPNRWSVERQVASDLATNNNLLRIRAPYDTTADIHYIGKRRPDPSDLSNVSDEVAQLIPWAVVGKLMAGVRSAPRRFDPPRKDRDTTEGGEFRDYRGFMAEFLRQRNALQVKLRNEVRQDKRYIHRPRRRRW